MRKFVIFVCSLTLITITQVNAQTISSTTNPAAQAFQPVAQQTQYSQGYSAQTYSPHTATQSAAVETPVATSQAQSRITKIQAPPASTAAVYQQPAYYSPQQNYYPVRQQVYYQRAAPTRYYPTRQVNYGNIPITQRPSRPGHPYGNAVRFLNRLGR